MTVKNDSPAERATRTFWQGLTATAVLTVATTISTAVFTPENIFDGAYWLTIIAAICVALLMSVASYTQKYFEDKGVKRAIEEYQGNESPLEDGPKHG